MRQGESVHQMGAVINIYETEERVEGGKNVNLFQSTRHNFQVPLYLSTATADRGNPSFTGQLKLIFYFLVQFIQIFPSFISICPQQR